MSTNKMFSCSFLAIGLLGLAPGLHAGLVLTATLLGSNEVPPNASPATGFITVTLNGDSLTVDESFSGLIGGTAAAAHIHCCAPGGTNAIVAIPFPGFPPTTSGTYNNTFDLTLAATYNAAFITAHGGTAASAEAAFIAALNSFQTYANIHDMTFPGGEIRGQLTPEPGTTLLVLAGLAPLIAFRRKTTSSRK